MRRSAIVLALAAVLGTAHLALAQAPPAGAAPKAAGPIVVISTSMGDMRVQLNPAKAPISVENFLGYVNKRFYDGTVFHRVIPTFMIQGGGFTPDLTKKSTGAPIAIESKNGLTNLRGSIAMARTADPGSATSQFFINTVDNPGLDYPKPDGHGYAVFGQVIEGLEVVDKIKAVKTTEKNGMRDVPIPPVVIKSIRVEK
jgi:peptidyl-prolyl cis-trans isomerase A (cyclophilin A)